MFKSFLVLCFESTVTRSEEILDKKKNFFTSVITIFIGWISQHDWILSLSIHKSISGLSRADFELSIHLNVDMKMVFF